MPDRKTLLLIDAHSILHRAYHALPPLTSPDGKPSQALYGLASMLWKLFHENKPDYAAAGFDLPEPTFRHKKFLAYKAQRPKTPDDLAQQLNFAPEVFSAFNVQTFSLAGYEGDDVIATLAEKFKKEKDLRIVILTGDLDTLQLVEDDHVVVKTFRKGLSDTFVYNDKTVQERYELKPSQMVDYKSLVGDPSDNIPGVPGVGPKTASEWLKRFSDLDGILRAVKSDEGVAKKISKYKKEAEEAKDLVTLQRDVPIRVGELRSLEIKEAPIAGIRDLCKKFGFESLLRRMADDGHKEEYIPSKNKRTKKYNSKKESYSEPIAQTSIFSQIEQIPNKTTKEVSSTNLVWINRGLILNKKDIRSSKTKFGFNLKDVLKRHLVEGQELCPPYFDLGVAFWLIDPDYKKYDRENLIGRFLKRAPSQDPEKDDLELYRLALAKLSQYGMTNLMLETEMPLLPVLAEMENTGVMLDGNILNSLARRIRSRIQENEVAIYKITGTTFNLNSPSQLSDVLYKRLSIPSKSTTKSFPSTKAEYLETIKDKHPIVRLILEYRSDFKILSTYLDPLGEKIDSSGRVHTDYSQTGAATGRLSAREPNLQNIPHGTPWAAELRRAFVAPEEYELASFDYSQLELRILASMSRDKDLIEAFQKGIDIHSSTASKIYKKDISDITPEERRVAKTLNFGLAYGMGVNAFSIQSGLPRKEAASFIEVYKAKFPGVSEWQKKIIQDMRKNGYTETITGRRRYFPELLSQDPRLLAEADRAAINHPIQGLEGDVIKKAMLAVKEKMAADNRWDKSVRLILSVHDELLFEIKRSMMKHVVPEIKRTMEEAVKLPEVFLGVEVKIGPNWNDLIKWTGN